MEKKTDLVILRPCGSNNSFELLVADKALGNLLYEIPLERLTLWAGLINDHLIKVLRKYDKEHL